MRAFVLSLVLAMLAACATLVPKLETPSLSIVNVEMLQSSVWEQRMKVRLRVQNPNDRALPIKGLSYTLDVADQELANGVSAASFTVPALGEAEFDMNVTANMASALIKLLGRNGTVGDQVDYRLRGKISLSEGFLRSIPFEEKGTFKLR